MKPTLTLLTLVLSPLVLWAQPNKVPGLELPPDQEVSSDEGFVLIQAQAKGEVKFLVLSTVKVKYSVSGNAAVVAVPPKPGTVVQVFAVSNTDNKLSDFAVTLLTVKGSVPTPEPTPVPTPTPKPPVISGRVHVSVIEDVQARTPDTAALLTSPTLFPGIRNLNMIPRLYDVRDPQLQTLKLAPAYQGLPLPVMVLQTDDGKVVPGGKALPLPKTEAEFLNTLKTLGGR